MKRDEKRKQAQDLHEVLEKARTVILSGFEGLTVAQDSELRRQVAKAGGKYKVVKNSVIERAAQGTPVEAVARNLKGTTSLTYTEAEPVTLAKALVTYAKENPALVFRTGLVEGRVVSLEDVTVIASLPSRDDLLSKVLYMINAPARQVAGLVAGVARNLAGVIQQGVKEKKFKEARQLTGG
jgi:large subunit ribosomal protein L10